MATRAAGDQEFHALLRKDFATSRQKDNQRYDSRKLLTLITKMLYRDGAMRWQREKVKQTDLDPLYTQQRALPSAEFLNRDSPLLADVIQYGRTCERSELSAFVFAVRQAHHPQGKQFLLDVLNEPSNNVESFPGTDDKSKQPDSLNPDDFPTIPTKPEGDNKDKNATGKWPFAPDVTSRFIAAVGLAELGVEDGIRWLIDHARPNDFGDGGTVWHHFHVRNRSSGGLRRNCEAALHDLSGLQDNGEEAPIDWDQWWRENKESFKPRWVALKETPGG